MDFDDFWSNTDFNEIYRKSLYSHIIYLYASQNPVLRDLGVLDPGAHVNLMYEPIVHLAACFAMSMLNS